MKRIVGVFAFGFILCTACASPVLNRDYLKESERKVSFNALRRNPDAYKGRIFAFGGIIIETKLTPQGSQVEALEVPVDRYGHFEEEGLSQGRFLAIQPSDRGILDPEVYAKGRRVTLAGEFVDLRKSRVDEIEYTYPVFLIRQIHLWPRERTYYPAHYYEPWFYPYPYYYWNPWWSYPYFYYDYRYWNGPIYRRIPGPGRLPPGAPPSLRERRPPARRAPQAPRRAPQPPPAPERVPRGERR